MANTLNGRLTPTNNMRGTLTNEGRLTGQLGGVGAAVTYASLPDKPSINNVELVGNKTTSDLNISYNDLRDKPVIPDVGEIDERLDDLEGDITSLGGRVTTAEGNITTLQGDTGALDTRLTTAEGNITSLGGRVTTAEGNITTLQGDTGALDTRLSTAEGNITSLGGRVTTNEGDISDLQGDMTQAQSDITQLNSSLSQRAFVGSQKSISVTVPANGTVNVNDANYAISGKTYIGTLIYSYEGANVSITTGYAGNTAGIRFVVHNFNSSTPLTISIVYRHLYI